jgi:hypothetical protein
MEKEKLMTDRYTQFIQTIIAVSLVIIILRDVPIVRNAIADSEVSQPIKVIIDDYQPVKVAISGITAWQPLPVQVIKK